MRIAGAPKSRRIPRFSTPTTNYIYNDGNLRSFRNTSSDMADIRSIKSERARISGRRIRTSTGPIKYILIAHKAIIDGVV